MESIEWTDMAQERSAADEQMNNIGRGQGQGDANSKIPADDSFQKYNFANHSTQFLCAMCCKHLLPIIFQRKVINDDLFPILYYCCCCERASNYGSFVSGADVYRTQQLT